MNGAAEVPSPSLQAKVDRLWPVACAHWATALQLGTPRVEGGGPAIAWMDLRDRRVHVSAAYVLGHGLESSLEAILAHEVGHHVRWPRSLATQARMRLLERQLVPLEGFTVINEFTDLLINQWLGERGLREQLVAVYGCALPDEGTPATFVFTLAVYEELWGLDPGTLIGPVGARRLAALHADFRDEAHLVAQDLFRLGPNVFTQQLFFLSIVSRYLTPDEPRRGSRHGHACRCEGEPSADDWASAITPSGQEKDAVERAAREGWLAPDQVRRMRRRSLRSRTAGLPGGLDEDLDAISPIMATWYRRQAERYLLRPPSVRQLGDAVVPTSTEDWEFDAPVSAIDWVATLRERGAIYGAARPLTRERVGDTEGQGAPRWSPRCEIYLDVSGSMPDPRFEENAMTLAATILATGTLRHGGEARLLLYSHEHVAHWTWTRSLRTLSEFMMRYVGGGTAFPFEVLEASVESERRGAPVRVVLTDQDFDFNLDADARAPSILRDAAASSPLVLVQYRGTEERERTYTSWGLRVVPVRRLGDFPRVASALAHALFDPAGVGEVGA